MTDHTVVELLPKDDILSIDDPTFSDSSEGNTDEEVIVVETAAGARAYPTRILQNHEVVNETIDGDPVAVTWCPLCASAVVYDRTVDGQTLSFGVSGKLADNDLVLYDRETESEWKQSSGRCLSGEYAGTTLTVLPAATMTLSAFEERYPDGEILQPPEWGTSDYSTDRFAEYMHEDGVGPGGDPRLRTEITDWPFEFHNKALTLGLTINGQSRGYVRPVIEEAGGIVTDTLGGTDIAVFASPAGLFAYEREGIEFTPAEEGGQVQGNGTTWDVATGRSANGRALDRLPSRRLFAFTWRDDNGTDAFYGLSP
ncbi:DUF3179 domain-containing protein [Halovenus sp. HT40]|uniref:DUF3179 domain-containing protein n=1 Tax=Halovenus sp. HT40 TaxID=3126691 RepID=UPI00300F07E5